MALPLYVKTNAMGLMLEGEDKDKLKRWTKDASSNKSVYLDEGEGSRNGVILEAHVAYWMS